MQLIQALTPTLDVLRLDLVGGNAPGNKSYKLRHNLRLARERGVTRVLSFGGAWSNHLHALAAVGAELGIETIGIVRGGETPTAMLADAQRWGMRLLPVSREEYRRRDDPGYQRELAARFHPCQVIPEGGANPEGVLGCREIAGLLPAGVRWNRLAVAVGSGATLAGLVASAAGVDEVTGIAALRATGDLETRVTSLLERSGLRAQLPWRIEHGFHCGGFARVDPALREFMLDFEARHGLALEPVYTGKLFLAVDRLLASGAWGAGERILALHTGGLQGRRGYPWLSPST